MKGLVEERRRTGAYRDLFDFARRLDTKAVNKRQLENLTRAGAFDLLEPSRARVLAGVETLMRYCQAVAAEKQSGMDNLFGGGGGPGLKEPDLPQAPAWDALEKLKHEFDAIGFYLSAHPLDAYGGPLRRLDVVKVAELPARLARGGPTRYKMAGIVINRQERTAKSGNRFAFSQLSDASGVFEVTLFQEVLAQSREHLVAGKAVLLSVDVQRQGEELRLTCQEVKPLEEVVATVAEGLRILLNTVAPVPALKSTLEGTGRGRGQIAIVVETAPFEEVKITLPGSYAITPKLRSTLKAIGGVMDVHDV
jgi:DNA polymerase-3 subunit alpha